MKKVEQYRSEAGNTFDNACDALKDDVRHWLIDAAGNDPIAKQVAARISEDIETFAPMIAQLAECCKPHTAEHAPHICDYSTVKGEQLRRCIYCNSQERIPVPPAVDQRPPTCRNRLRDEGKSYPRSGCVSCGDGGMRGCPHERYASIGTGAL